MPQPPNDPITPEQLALWRRISDVIISGWAPGDAPGTLLLLANAVRALLAERELAHNALMQARDAQRRNDLFHAELSKCPARGGARDCIESMADAGACMFCGRPMPLHLHPQQRLTFSARVAELERQLRELRAALGLGTDGSFRSIVARIEKLETSDKAGGDEILETQHRLIETRDWVQRLNARVQSLEKHAIEASMLLYPASGPDARCSLPGVAQRVGTLETALLQHDNVKAVRDAIRGQTAHASEPPASEPPAPPAEPHQPEPIGPPDAHATCIGLDNGCPECLKARDADQGPRDTEDHGALRSAAQIRDNY